MKKILFIAIYILILIYYTHPQSGTLYFNRGNELYKQKRYKEAVEEYTKAIEINKNDTDALNNRGIAYYQIGKYIEAINDFNKVIESEPDALFTYQSRAITYNTIGLHIEANADYKKVIELNPDFVYSYFGILYTSYYISKKEFKSSYKLLLDNKEKFKNRQWEYELANFICGKINIKKILEIAGNDNQKLSEVYFTIGFIYKIKKRSNEAKEYFTKCTNLNISDSQEYFFAKLELTKLKYQ
jgi:tetratricopeptide (TPR) repeat protein